MTTRRDFLKQGAVAGGAILAAASPALAQAALRGSDRVVAPMNILIFGGTGFIGPHLVREAISRGHKVTIFSRGRRDGGLPDSVERLVGDRMINDTIPQGNLKALDGRRFDAVIDDPATDPRWVRQSATMLRDSGSYMFVSSTGVFLPYLTSNNDENAPVLLTAPDGSPPQYGHQKAQCEAIVKEIFGERGTVIRPGYIVGPGDTTDRFSYWPQRLAKGGEMLVPGKKSDPSQLIDVRDLTPFMVSLVEQRRGGIYNAAGPREKLTFGQFMSEAHAAVKSETTPVWVDDYAFLREKKMTYAIPWMIPEGDNQYHLQINNRKAVAAGLTFRPIAETVRDTLATWPARLAELQPGQQPNFRWITPEKEAQVLAEWKARGR
ncbi:MAG: NAD-dependent epimerase/dehydratase family protein [Gemmatimonadaceae bacterium]